MAGLLNASGVSDDFDDSLALTTLLIDREDETKVSEYDALHEKVKDAIDADKAKDITDAVAESTTPTEAVAAPSEPPVAESEPTPNEPDSKATESDSSDPEEVLTDKEGVRSSVATESLRNDYYDRLVLEAISYDDVSNAVSSVASSAYSGVSFFATKMKLFITTLFELGVTYSPGAARLLKKGVIYLYTKAARAFLATMIATANFVKRYVHSIENAKSDIRSMRELVGTLKQQTGIADLTGRACTDESILSWLTYNGKTDALGSATLMTAFLTSTVENIDRGILHDLDTVQKLIDLSKNGVRGNALSFMSVPPFSGSYLRKAVRGYVKDPDLVESRVYSSALPDKILFVVNLPRVDLTEIELISKAYQESGIFLAVDSNDTPSADKLDYMDIAGVERLLDRLEQLCDVSINHLSFYARIEKHSDSLKFGYRNYYQKLVESAASATVRSSLVEYVYLKQSFVNKVYLPASMDIHDYVSAYLVRACRFAKANLKALASENKN